MYHLHTVIPMAMRDLFNQLASYGQPKSLQKLLDTQIVKHLVMKDQTLLNKIMTACFISVPNNFSLTTLKKEKVN